SSARRCPHRAKPHTSSSPRYPGALLVAGLDVDRIGHVLELVGGHAVRESGHPRTIDEQLALLFRGAARLNELSFCAPARIQLRDIGGSSLCVSRASQIGVSHGQERVIESKGLPHEQSIFDGPIV